MDKHFVGDSFGEMALVSEDNHRAETVRAAEAPTVLIVIPITAYQRIFGVRCRPRKRWLRVDR